jgi:hypothetical protein
MDERDENLGNAFGDSSGDAGDEVWRGLATGGVDNNKLGGGNVGVGVDVGVDVGVIKLEAVFIKICIRCIYI